MSHLDDMPTPELGQPLQLPPDESVSRRRTPVHGVPEYLPERASHRVIVVDPHPQDETTATSQFAKLVSGEVERALKRKLRHLWTGLAGLAGGLVVAIVGAGKALLADARTDGAERERAETMRRDVDRLRKEIDQLLSHVYRIGSRRDEPDPPAPAATPISKGQ